MVSVWEDLAPVGAPADAGSDLAGVEGALQWGHSESIMLCEGMLSYDFCMVMKNVLAEVELFVTTLFMTCFVSSDSSGRKL